MEDNVDISGDCKISMDLVSFCENFRKECAALKKIPKGNGIQISGVQTRLEKHEKSQQKEVRDLKKDFVDPDERTLESELYKTQDTFILKIPPKLNGKSCAEVLPAFLNHFF